MSDERGGSWEVHGGQAEGGAGSPLSFACYSQNSVGGRGILQRAAGAIFVEDRQTSSLLPHLRDRKIPAKRQDMQGSSELVRLLLFLLNSS